MFSELLYRREKHIGWHHFTYYFGKETEVIQRPRYFQRAGDERWEKGGEMEKKGCFKDEKDMVGFLKDLIHQRYHSLRIVNNYILF